MSTVLVVDDEKQILRTLGLNLRARGFDVELAATGSAALEVAARAHPDVVVLDLGLPDLDGIEVVHGLRGWSTVPIVVLSAREREADKVAALDAGADDYITKPFGIDELVARVRAAIRRAAGGEAEQPVVETADFRVDLGTKTVTAGAEVVHLTRTQWRLVELLASNPGRLVTYRQLLLAGWGPGYENETKYVRVFMAQIRQKLEPDPARPRYFLTEAGMGCRFTPSGSG